MSDVVIVGLLSLAGTLIGSVAGIMTANKLTNYRIGQLEKKVDKHNGVMERTYRLEDRDALREEQIEAANHRIENLEKIVNQGRNTYEH